MLEVDHWSRRGCFASAFAIMIIMVVMRIIMFEQMRAFFASAFAIRMITAMVGMIMLMFNI